MQDRWLLQQQRGTEAGRCDGSLLLQVIANAAASFPEADSAKLLEDLLQV